MTSFQNVNKLIENLNSNIRKLDTDAKVRSNNIIQIQKNNNISNSQSSIRAYGITHPKIIDKNKKYIGLMFDENFNDFTSENSSGSNSKLSFIKLKPGNNIINYSVCVDIDDNTKLNKNTSQQNSVCSISLGIKENSNSNSKVRFIKGSKIMFNPDSKYDGINNKVIINNTIIYISSGEEDLCMVGDFNTDCKVNSSKSLIKILTM
jgi:hypothetical protein